MRTGIKQFAYIVFVGYVVPFGIFPAFGSLGQKVAHTEPMVQKDIKIQSTTHKPASLNIKVSNHLTDRNANLHVEICSYKKIPGPAHCLKLTEHPKSKGGRPVLHGKSRNFTVSEKILGDLLGSADDYDKIQLQFRDSHAKTNAYWSCTEHPFTSVGSILSRPKTFEVEVFKTNLSSYSCYIYERFGAEKILTHHEESFVDKIVSRFKEYTAWVAKDDGLTFAVDNKIRNEDATLKVQICSYTEFLRPQNCITMADDDYIEHGKERVYHVEKAHLEELLGFSDGSRIQFRFKDTYTSFDRYLPCENNLYTIIDHTKKSGHRYKITVTRPDNLFPYSCTMEAK